MAKEIIDVLKDMREKGEPYAVATVVKPLVRSQPKQALKRL